MSCPRYDVIEVISNSQILANFSAFEVDDEVLGSLREYGLANSLYWALAEGHACEQSARRNAMDVSITETLIT